MDYALFLNMFCCIVSVVTLMAYASVISIRKTIVASLPKSLRYHFTFTIFPFAILTTLCSLLCTIFYFTNNSEKVPSYQYMAFTLTFTSQMLRISYFLIVIERIVATICLEKYRRFSAGLIGFYTLTLVSYLSTGLYLIPALSWIVNPFLRLLYDNLLYFVVAMHISTMIGCRVLYLKNKRMYQQLAYRVTLDRRCQILENIKVTMALWKPILAFALIGPIGLIIMAVSILIGHKVAFAHIHLFYNLSFIIAIIQKHITSKYNQTLPLPYENTVMGPMGKFLPTLQSIDHHFANLKKQWD